MSWGRLWLRSPVKSLPSDFARERFTCHSSRNSPVALRTSHVVRRPRNRAAYDATTLDLDKAFDLDKLFVKIIIRRFQSSSYAPPKLHSMMLWTEGCGLFPVSLGFSKVVCQGGSRHGDTKRHHLRQLGQPAYLPLFLHAFADQAAYI